MAGYGRRATAADAAWTTSRTGLPIRRQPAPQKTPPDALAGDLREPAAPCLPGSGLWWQPCPQCRRGRRPRHPQNV